MLRPRDTPTRERKRLDGLWRFALDPSGEGRAGGWWRRPLRGAVDMPVPASYNDIFASAEMRNHVGDAWYQTAVHVPTGWRGQRIVLRFDAATHSAVVWVDDEQVMDHEGGYTPFEADITDVVEPGTEVRISAVVSNVLTWQTIPPGEVLETADGRRRQQVFHDFFNYAGLPRSVWLYTTPPSYVTDVTVTTEVAGSSGTVHYDVATAGSDGEVTAVLRDADRNEVARATGAAGDLTVEGAQLWRPGEGFLYDLALELRSRDGELVDTYSLPVGIRTVRIDGSRFLINDEPFHFKGFGKHEDASVRGKAHDDVFMVHDFALMDWLGANSFRTSHYPYAEEVLEYADRRGIVVIDETAAVGINSGLAAGYFGAEPHKTFSPETVNEVTRQAHSRAIRELIARDKNHPCVVLWCIANEPESVTPESRTYFEPLVAETRRLDGTRPIGFANVMSATPDLDVLTDLFDVVMLNRYFGWYTTTGDLISAEQTLESEIRAWVEKSRSPRIPGLRRRRGCQQPHAIVGYALYLWCFATSREVVEREASDVPARDVVRMIRDNRPLLLLCGSALLFLTGMFAMSTVAVFYARDVLGDASLYVAMTVVQTGAMVAAAALVPGLAGVIGRKRLYILAGGLAAIGAVGFAMAPASVPAIAIACYGIVGLGFGVINTLIFAFQADTVDYGEWRSGIRAEGGSYAVLSFTRKAGQAVGGAAAAYTIGFGGYVSGATTQSDAALAAIRGAAGIVPAVGVAAAAAMMLAYPLTEDRFRELIRELTARRGENRGDQSTPPGATPAAAT